jgi:ferredoxin
MIKKRIMKIAKVWAEDGCISCGVCEDICPQVFLIKDISTVIEDMNFSEYDAKIRETADGCPVEVIKFSEY